MNSDLIFGLAATFGQTTPLLTDAAATSQQLRITRNNLPL